jgi:purine-binding chemotaxis protein CheW
MIPGFVMFSLGAQRFALRLAEVREIVRLDGLEPLPGASAPLAGLIVLRGNPLPVLDVRAAGSLTDVGDVLVMELDGDPVGVAVDEVLAVLTDDELPEANETVPKAMPSYVVGARRAANRPVLVVDLRRLLDVCAKGWTDSLAASRPLVG